MPYREYRRDRDWLIFSPFNEFLAQHHPARLVAAFVDELKGDTWWELGVTGKGIFWGLMRIPLWTCYRCGLQVHDRSALRPEARDALPGAVGLHGLGWDT